MQRFENTICRAALSILLVVSALLSACAEPSLKDESALRKVTICQWGQALIYLPLYIAMQEGFFEDEGLDVTLTNGGADDLTWAAVISGSAQFGVADPTMIAVQSEQGGVPGRMVATVVGRVAFWAISLDSAAEEITKPEDFRGHTVAAFRFPNTANALALRTFQKARLELGKDVSIVPVDYGAVLAQLLRGEASLAMVLEPAASLAEAEGAKVVYSYAEDWGEFAFTGLTTTEELIQKDPALVQAVVNALQRAVRLAHTDLERAVENGIRAFPDLSPDVIETAVKRMLDEGTLPAHVTPSLEGWNRAIEVNIEVGKLRQAPDPQKMLDDSFALRAVSSE
ncbi:MAG: ABC transporter substrate-binding protein [Deltaproteobacteria bacterium]|nr:ABC transporter substrate-binding protein [Deltaproteobacteria bacterium]